MPTGYSIAAGTIAEIHSLPPGRLAAGRQHLALCREAKSY